MGLASTTGARTRPLGVGCGLPVDDQTRVGSRDMGSYSVHKCDPEGAPLGALDGPTWAEPGRVVWLAETDLYGRVRLWWRCCGVVLVELLAFPNDPDDGVTVTGRVRLDELSPPPAGVSYSVPCVGAEWSLMLPCGDLAGEGCDCATIAAEMGVRDQGRSQWEINETSLPG